MSEGCSTGAGAQRAYFLVCAPSSATDPSGTRGGEAHHDVLCRRASNLGAA